jgi:hypothetical protein
MVSSMPAWTPRQLRIDFHKDDELMNLLKDLVREAVAYNKPGKK